ncbi:MAG: diacylglycerol/lipid kinase family protein [Bacillota bacterium]|jgi:diacylglycerol kinase (ATP)
MSETAALKHVFLLNPVAGTKKFQRDLPDQIAAAAAELGFDYELRVTTSVGDAKRFAAAYDKDTAARFYAIGGDGTLNETVNGILERPGVSELALIPCGTGDDFARFFPNRADFRDIAKTAAAKAVPIDAIATDLGLCGVNMVNIGVDAQTAADVHRFSEYVPGTAAYVLSLLNRVLLHRLGIAMEISIDDEPPLTGDFLLVSFANGSCCGGGFRAAPKARIDDGLLEICAVRPLSKVQFAKMVGGYKAGTHLDDPRYQKYITYRRGRKVSVRTETPTQVCIDGEIITTDRVTAEILPHRLRFVIP